MSFGSENNIVPVISITGGCGSLCPDQFQGWVGLPIEEEAWHHAVAALRGIGNPPGADRGEPNRWRRNPMRKLMFAIMIAVTALSGQLLADGGDERTRPATAEEKAWHREVLEKAMSALPPANDGWTRNDETIDEIEKVYVAQTSHLWNIHTGASYEKNIAFDASKMSELSSSIEDLQAKLIPLTEKLTKAAEKGDQQEIALIQKEMQDLQAGNAGLAKMNDISEEREKGTARVEVTLNHAGMDFDFVKELPGKVRGAIVLRRDPTTVPKNLNYGKDGITWVLFGTFKKEAKPDGIKAYADRSGAFMQVKTVVVQITARDTTVADDLLARMNADTLAKLVQ